MASTWSTCARVSILFACLVLAATACVEDEADAPTPDVQPPERASLASLDELDDATLAELSTVTTAPGDIPRLEIVVDGERRPLPLEHTHVSAEVSGSVARVEVIQTYQNPLDAPIEATYVFPLPENSAVDAMRMVIGERVIEAEIHKRDEARQIYETAKSEGHTTALLEQERPNVFTQSVANIAPGESIEVVVRYVQPVTYDHGGYEFVFPMVVGPRYVPSAPGSRHLVPDTSQVPDWQRITPPILGKGLRTGHDISLELIADVGLEVADIDSPTHQIALEDQGQGRFELVLAEQESQPNRDFVVRYRVAGAQPVVGLVSHKASEQAEFGHFSLMVQPPALELDDLVGERELIFVVDVSGSMGGRPLAQCKQAMRQLLAGLRPTDTFNVITFSGRDTKLFEHSVPVSDDTVRRTIDFLAGLRANGGTNLGSAVESALGAEPVDGRNRYVFFMTDAQVGQEDAILGGAEQLVARFGEQGARARVFSFGVGYHPNQHLIERLAEVGDGLAVYATADEDPARAVDRFFGLIDHPVMEQVWVDWGALPVESVQPARVPDLFASRPLELHGRYAGAGGTGEVVVHGRIEGQPIELVFDVELPSGPHGSPAQATLWARSRIADFERDLWSGHEVAAAKTAITELALEHGLVTKFTSFVAVDRSRVVGNGDPTRIDQPTEPRDGLSGDEAGKRLGAADPTLVSPDLVAPMVEKLDKPVGIQATMSSNLLGAGGSQGLFGGGDTFGGSLDPSAMSGEGGAFKSGLGYGGLGATGTGAGGGGTGAGRIGGLADKSTGGGHGSGRTSRPRPKVTFGTPEVGPGASRDNVKKVVKKKGSALRNCYERQLLADPTLTGEVTVTWAIKLDGTVSDVALVDHSLDTAGKVASCVQRVVKRMRFDKPDAGVVAVRQTLVFEPGAVTISATPAVASTRIVAPTAVEAATVELSVSGALSRADVSRVLDAQRLELSGCRHVDDGTYAAGALSVVFTVDGQGFTGDIELEGDDRVTGCLAERIGSWRFPVSAGETRIETSM